MICVQKFSRPEGIKGKEKYRLEHEAGLRLLSQALCGGKGLSGLTVEELEKKIQKKPGGKPYFPEFPKVHFNLSHSEDAAACALGRAPVGIDVEKLRPFRLSYSGRMLTAGEQAYLEGCSESGRDREFFRIWTLKESLAKAMGLGLGLDFRQVEFLLTPWEPETEGKCRILQDEDIRVRFLHKEGDCQREWHFAQTIWEEEYVVSFCGQERADGILFLPSQILR